MFERDDACILYGPRLSSCTCHDLVHGVMMTGPHGSWGGVKHGGRGNPLLTTCNLCV